MSKAVGTCSQCGGRVYKDMEGNLTCSKCGAFKSNLPIIQMPSPFSPYEDKWTHKKTYPYPWYEVWC